MSGKTHSIRKSNRIEDDDEGTICQNSQISDDSSCSSGIITEHTIEIDKFRYNKDKRFGLNDILHKRFTKEISSANLYYWVY